ncbi:hypothetical protein [Oceanotoga teriensis]|jgi:hypothetical protein|uniref:Uncharacterized protein n=1 Tax=Oceanotoga teriensis TaxID=515440 RepID=A0AA45C8P7_9BACT|nr:hypothetical protein [Oceanotoga teriensis]MDO7975470.1 hypothetical protein [Oceanotoga teriensis]PWJ96242.1 hypothetical protein C7380_102159 [Oceanotoga teriensis]
MKKLIVILLLFTSLISIGFSLDLDVLRNNYNSYISEYKSGNEEGNLKDFYIQLENLGIYKFYRNIMIGSAEYIDRPTNIQTYLSNIYNSMEFDNYEEKIAFAGFLAYVQSDFSGQRLSKESVRSLPAYFTTIQDYRGEIQDESLTYLGNVIAYSLGLVESSPYKNIKKFDMKASIDNYDLYTYSGEAQTLYDSMIEKNKIDLESKIKDISTSDLNGEELEYAIDDLSYEFLQSLTEQVDDELTEVINIIMQDGKISLNLYYLRFIVYVIIFILFYFFYKKFIPYISLIIFLSESFYMLFIFDALKDTISSFIYGSYFILFIGIFAIITLLSVFKRRANIFKRISNSLIFIGLLLLILIPSYYSEDLLMKNNVSFENSEFQKQLMSDILYYDHAPVMKSLDFIRSELGQEYSEINLIYKNELNAMLKKGIDKNIYEYVYADEIDGIDIKTLKEGLKFNNIENYQEIAKEYSRVIEKAIKVSELRSGRVNNEMKVLKDNIADVIRYSDEDFMDYYEKEFFKITSNNELLQAIEKDTQEYFDETLIRNKIPLKAYNTSWGTSILIIFLLSILIFIIFEQRIIKNISSIMMILASILSFIKPDTLEVISQIKFPTVHTYDFSVNIFYGAIMLVISLLIYFNQRGGSKV